jgi:proteasome lid subunit RPN8/RPN11
LARTSTKKPIVERCWILIGEHQGPFWYARRTRPTRGKPVSVEFDAAWVLRREETMGDIVGFYHTHPSGVPSPSARDDRTMWAWSSALGKPLLCWIESGGVVAAFRYDDDRSAGIRLPACQLFVRGVVVAFDVEGSERK